MYESHFGLRARPFRPVPDAGSYYPATGHEQALDRLLSALRDGEGIALLTGPPGTGKTLLCHILLERLGEGYDVAFLTNSHVGDGAGLVRTILHDLSLPFEGKGDQELRLGLTDRLLQTYAQGRHTLVIADEAQNLPPDALEELRLLGNLEGRDGRAVQVLLLAQPEFLDPLRMTSLPALRQRISVGARLAPLSVEEAADYLFHHVRAAGGRPDKVFADEAISVLANGTKGVPRLLNQAAHQALGLACKAGMEQVDAEAAVEALALCGLEAKLEDQEDAPSDDPDDDRPGLQPRLNGKAKHGADEDGQMA